MVSNKDIKALDFKTIDEYFDYIVASEINGNRSQVHELVDELSKQQKKDFLEYMQNMEHNIDREIEIVKNIVITSM